MKIWNSIITVVFALILLNVAGYFNIALAKTEIATYIKYICIVLIIIYLLKNEMIILDKGFLIFLILYFLFSGINTIEKFNLYILEFIKSILLFIFFSNYIKINKLKTVLIIILIGAITIIVEFFIFKDYNIGGRYSGIFLNPNGAAYICIFGYTLSFMFNGKLKYICILIFSFAGLITFSRTFLVLWLLVTLYFIYKEKKNLIILIISFFIIILLNNYKEDFEINSRFDFISQFFLDEKPTVSFDEFNENSREVAWQRFYSKLLNGNLFIGNGYRSFQGSEFVESKNNSLREGVHNSYLMILGEAGIFVFILFLLLNIQIIIKLFQNDKIFLMIFLTMLLFITTSHNFFETSLNLLIYALCYNKINEVIKN